MARAVSAPGKVLLAGGYLVLDRAHTGLVFGLDARIHTHVQSLPTVEGVTLQEVVVRSPQFDGATWRYGYSMGRGKGSGVIVTELKSGHPSESPSRNSFIETALAYAFTYILATAKTSYIAPSIVTILADNDYYSTPDATISTSTHPKRTEEDRFSKFSTTLELTHKTGLGSSAALVTSFIAAVLSHYLPASVFKLEDHKQQLHNLAQAAHCAAQGKVGSGFDVASAVFGSCVYRRFSPKVLETLGDVTSGGFLSRLQAVTDGDGLVWDQEIKKGAVQMPSNLRLVMVDVDCGSKTPGMVKQVLQWRKENPLDAQKLWGELQFQNEALATELVQLTSGSRTDGFTMLRDIIARIRTLARDMTSRAGVPIEPQAQTKLLDACTEIDGVVGGVTPGAGGYDAVALLVEDSDEVLSNVQTLLQRWKFAGQDGRTSSTRLLGVRQEMEGVLVEDPAQYRAWIG
ncbi:MAG: phosphomevalonate kinase [Chrysothrix sp. TS-e1954]|nr:MAG: phosphomevalonate kinase [Chrysothrix sp. TS-e1954]